MSVCCEAASDRKTPTWMRGLRELLAWGLPSTGLGLSFSTASYLRWVLLFLCIASLSFVIVERLVRLGTVFRYFKKDAEQCNTKS
jgi:hypothetical protein